VLRPRGPGGQSVRRIGTAALSSPYAYLRKIFDVNYFGAWLMCRAVFPYMKQQRGGVVINQSSAAAWMHPDIPFEGDELPAFH